MSISNDALFKEYRDFKERDKEHKDKISKLIKNLNDVESMNSRLAGIVKEYNNNHRQNSIPRSNSNQKPDGLLHPPIPSQPHRNPQTQTDRSVNSNLIQNFDKQMLASGVSQMTVSTTAQRDKENLDVNVQSGSIKLAAPGQPMQTKKYAREETAAERQVPAGAHRLPGDI